jgi:hypothetical protein
MADAVNDNVPEFFECFAERSGAHLARRGRSGSPSLGRAKTAVASRCMAVRSSCACRRAARNHPGEGGQNRWSLAAYDRLGKRTQNLFTGQPRRAG